MEKTESDISLPYSLETYEFLVEKLTKENSFGDFGGNNLGAEFESDPDDQCSIMLQKVPLSINQTACQTSMTTTFPPGTNTTDQGILTNCYWNADYSPPSHENEAKTLPLVPSNTEYAGNYQFAIDFEKINAPLTKSTPWAYSTSLNKLFVRRDVPCPVRFKTSVDPPAGSYIRALMMFCKMEDINDIVQRCPADAAKNSKGYKDPNHVLHCTAEDTVYEKCPKTGRLSIRFELDEPQAGTDYCAKMLKFGCYTSCNGGMNRRQTQVIFTLEHMGQTLGRRKIDVRICACPGRDIRNAEGGHRKPKKVPELTKEEEADANASTDELSSDDEKKSRKVRFQEPPRVPEVQRQSSGNVNFTLDISRFGVKEHDDELFALVVRGRENFAILSKLKESLELKESLSSDVVRNYRSTVPPSGPLKDFLQVYQSNTASTSPAAKKRKLENDKEHPEADDAVSSSCTGRKNDVQAQNDRQTLQMEYERCVVTRTVSFDKLGRDYGSGITVRVKEENE